MKYIPVLFFSLLAVSCSNSTQNTDNSAVNGPESLEKPADLILESENTEGMTAYEKAVINYRLQKDRAYKTGENSPLEPSDKGAFRGLNYFRPDSTYRVTVTMKPLTPETVSFKTTTDRVAMYTKYAELQFSIKDKPLKLYAYVEAESLQAGLFIPFKDSTTGKTTYGGGRFIEMPMPEGNSFELDFNFAFNPYCHYNHNYSCPIVPDENTLPASIEAGEKMLY